MLRIVLVSVVLLQFTLISSTKADCEINPATANAPLLVTSNQTDLLYPHYGATKIKFRTGEAVDFVCPGGNVQLGIKTKSGAAKATCLNGTTFLVEGEIILWQLVTCSSDPVSNSRYTGNDCSSGREIETGFSLQDGRFIRVLLVCYDPKNQTALYVGYKVINSIGARISGTPRPTWVEEEFYSLGNRTVNSLYVRANQRATVNSLIGLNSTDTKYIQDDSLHYLARGHIAARADFFYGAEQNATFTYINGAPQWQTFNGYNWNQVENDTREYAHKNNVTLDIWTGVYGVTTLPHATTGQNVPLYLFVNDTLKALPVPSLYWRIVYEPASKRGVGLFGVNNAYETNVNKYVICTDISTALTWLNWNRTSLIHGYSYACSVADLRRAIPYAPNLSVTGVLGSSSSTNRMHIFCAALLIMLTEMR